ncbi:MAG: helix-turn-helix transcriptional regulator [Deltaproteobacteria bacterium]|nr:helix-turn-helix transcriptional regulator [Nannocystaceae bacterium]
MARSYSCPVELALHVLGGKWRVVVLAHIKDKPLRYAELRRLAPRMSEKMLTQRLRELVDAGLITRRGERYGLTERGESAREVLGALYRWGSAVAPQLGARIEAPARSRLR